MKRYWRIDTSKVASSVDKSDTMKKSSFKENTELDNARHWKQKWPQIFNEMLSPTVDFPPKYHPIHDYFGINEFVVLSPNIPNEKEDIDNETRAKIAVIK